MEEGECAIVLDVDIVVKAAGNVSGNIWFIIYYHCGCRSHRHHTIVQKSS